MKKVLIVNFLLLSGISGNVYAQKIKLNDKSVSAVTKGTKALTFSDADAAALAGEAVAWMDANNPVAAANDPYAVRLNKLVAKHFNEDGLKLNFKVYKVVDINAFACADGSVRVFAGLMDLMTDEEILGVIGHEIGHVKNHDTRDAIRDAYKRAAIADAASSQSNAARTLTQSELGDLANALLTSSYSRKQESDADAYAYGFMKKHGYSVMALASAFDKLAELSAGAPEQSKAQKMFNSHPDSGKRAATIREKAQKDGIK